MEVPNLWQDRTIALAGVTQAVALVDQLARTGYLDTQCFETCIHSLFQLTPDSTADVFAGADKLQKGLSLLNEMLENPRANERGNQMLGYCLGVLHLQRRLQKNARMLDEISGRLVQAKQQAEHFGPSHDNVVANLADIYTTTISTFQFRIQVVGEYQYLQQPRLANQVRVALFAAIRAAMLWRQVGGTRLQLLFQRGQLGKQAQQLLRENQAGR